MKTVGTIALAVYFALTLSAGSLPSAATGSWDAKKAAAYLDQREKWWMSWPAAARDHGTFCISCHTALPYALARPVLRAALGEEAASPNESSLLDNVSKRVRLWKEVEPFYGDEHADKTKADESRGSEAVLNALILVSHDARSGILSNETRIALDNMWPLQQTAGGRSGAWWWLDFNQEPFEAHDSDYYGAALAAVAVGMAGDSYRAAPEIQKHLELLKEYLNREYAKQSAINQVVFLWASSRWPGLIAREQQQAMIRDILRMQETDGGWNLASLAWTWRGWTVRSVVKMFTQSYGTRLKGTTDGYATALITFVLQEAGLPRDNPHLTQARTWLIRKQNKAEGYWRSYSLNNGRDPSSGTGLFMTDAATAYAVLALTDMPKVAAAQRIVFAAP